MSIQGFDPNFELVRQGLSSIEFFRELHASSAPSTTNAQAVVDGMRTKADSIKQLNPHAAALLENVAQGIELYIGLKPLNQ
jgi:hypothetical protein